MEFVFWLTVLVLWFIIVIKGLVWIERALNNCLDRWFVRVETNDEGDV